MDKFLRSRFEKKQKVNPVATGIVGAVAGAAVGTAATVLLTNEENRQKLNESFQTIKKQAVDKFYELKDKTYSMSDKAEKKVTKKLAQKV